MPPPPYPVVELSDNVQPLTDIVPSFQMAPPLVPKAFVTGEYDAELLERVQLLTVKSPLLRMPPPLVSFTLPFSMARPSISACTPASTWKTRLELLPLIAMRVLRLLPSMVI